MPFFLSKANNPHIHEQNLRLIIAKIGCEPIEPEDFLGKIQQYIKTNQMRK